LLSFFSRVGTDHLVDGGKKDASFIASLFDPWVVKLDPLSTRIDSVFFDGASNVQKAGRLLEAKYPRIHVQTCAAHAVSLFFSDLFKDMWQFRLLLVNYRLLYRIFGSGSMHSPYALFMNQSKQFNHGRRLGLIRAAGTRMAGHAYAQIRMLRLKAPLLATINSAAYIDLKLKGFPKKVERFLSNPDMWHAVFVIERCLYPMIRVLRLCDTARCGGMSKLLYFVHKTDAAIEQSVLLLKDLKYFDDHVPSDANDVDGLDLEDGDFVDPVIAVAENDSSSESDSDEEDIYGATSLGEQILSVWKKRRQKLITPLSVAGWYCSPHPDIRKDVVDRETGANRLDMEKVITKIFYPMTGDELGGTIETFWREFNEFQTKQGPGYSRHYIWNVSEIKEGKCHLWHKLYSLKFTEVFGKVACRVCSKPLGCGQAERNWGALKHVKSGKRSHMSSDKAERLATVFGAACIDRMRAMEASEEVEFHWTDADFEVDLGLENWEDAPGNVPVPVAPKRIFRAWIEDWEWECIRKNDPVAEARLLQKYGGMRWFDPDLLGDGAAAGNCTADIQNMEFRGRDGGWHIIGLADRDGSMEPWDIDIAIDLIAEFRFQPAELNVEVVIDDEFREANHERSLDIRAAKQQKRKK
jgi:hypothetical protein